MGPLIEIMGFKQTYDEYKTLNFLTLHIAEPFKPYQREMNTNRLLFV